MKFDQVSVFPACSQIMRIGHQSPFERFDYRKKDFALFFKNPICLQ